jgi:hypothetical protein
MAIETAFVAKKFVPMKSSLRQKRNRATHHRAM